MPTVHQKGKYKNDLDYDLRIEYQIKGGDPSKTFKERFESRKNMCSDKKALSEWFEKALGALREDEPKGIDPVLSSLFKEFDPDRESIKARIDILGQATNDAEGKLTAWYGSLNQLAKYINGELVSKGIVDRPPPPPSAGKRVVVGREDEIKTGNLQSIWEYLDNLPEGRTSQAERKSFEGRPPNNLKDLLETYDSLLGKGGLLLNKDFILEFLNDSEKDVTSENKVDEARAQEIVKEIKKMADSIPEEGRESVGESDDDAIDKPTSRPSPPPSGGKKSRRRLRKRRTIKGGKRKRRRTRRRR